MEMIVEIPNFIEVESVDAANKVSLKQYVFLDRFSAERRKYCFKIRQNKLVDK